MTRGTATKIDFDDDQLRVVEHDLGAMTALGGPGTGKSSVLEERFVRLALQEGCSPDRILFLVPNRAQKMALQDRLTRRLLFDEGLDALIEVPVYTWHGLANHLVSRHYDKLGYSEPPVLLTSPEHWGAVRQALTNPDESVNWGPNHRHLLNNRGFADEIVDFCIRAEQRVLREPELNALANARPEWADVIQFFKAHRRRMQMNARVDYPMLLNEATDLLANFDDVREALHARFVHVLVDDGQELALVQQRMLHFLTQFGVEGVSDASRSLVLAGDPDSAIETFRGAEPEWIDDFAKEFGPHESVTLSTCYRQGQAMGSQTTAFIARNGDADHRPAAFKGHAEIEVHAYQSLAAEVDSIARAIRLAHLEDKIPFEDMAILLTSPRSMLPPLERALDALEVPFSIAAPDRPLGREPIVRAFTDLATFAFEDEPAPEKLVELLRSPLIDLEDATVRELERIARVKGAPLGTLLEELPEDVDVDPEAAAKVAELLELRDLLRSKKDAPADQAFWVVWDRSRLCAALQERARRSLSDPAHRDLDALVAFSRALGRFVERRRGHGTFQDYLGAIGRADFGSDPWLPPERSAGGVNVVSFHGAKGKEWSLVAVAGAVEGSIPKGRRATGLFDPYFLDETNVVQRARKNEMEDRRVFYVALTRATKRCIVTTSPGPSRRGEPSRFIEELFGAFPEVEQPAEDMRPLTFAEAAARYRRVLANTSAPASDRIAALAALKEINKLDPSCSAAQPGEWWWRWDWTAGEQPLRLQQQKDDDDLPLDKLRTSYSRIGTYDNCGLQYLLSVVLGLDPESSHNMAFGSWVHKVFETIELEKITPTEAYALYDRLFDESVFPNKAIARQFHRDGQLMIMRYGKYLKPYEAVQAETKFTVELDGHRVTGRIDRIDRLGKNLVISDYKTSSAAIGWDEARESLQLAIYYLAAKNDPQIAELGEPASMQLIYPKPPLVKGDVVRRNQKPEDAEKVLERLPGLMEGVLAEDFRPNPEADCTWCKFKPLCPLWSEGKELPA
ncbi:MAG: ATP-dependent helicase [Actinomycetota bacterium]|nr:ATP-dependent helicase [Actinomycetota bacterium]